MKKLYFFSALFFSIMSLHSQTQITLTFQAKDSLTQSALALDSLRVENLTENCDTTLYDAVSVLNIIAGWPVGIDHPETSNTESFIVIQNAPNPFHGTTTVRIFLGDAGELNMAVFDNSGNKLSGYHDRFGKGWHLFAISESETRMMFLQVSDRLTTKTIRLLSTGMEGKGEGIVYRGQSGSADPTMKSGHDAAGFVFYLGNQLQYTAYVQGYQESVRLDNPVSSETYVFPMLPVVLPAIPSVSTSQVTGIMQTTATSGGNVTNDGGATVTARGVCWSTSPGPTTSGNHTTDGSGTGIFVSNLTGLTPGTPYYLRAYATNSVGTAYGNELAFTTLSAGFTCGNVVTYSGKNYNTVLIGSQCWFRENLNVGNRVNGGSYQTNNGVMEKYCYANLESNCDVYGGLYEWHELMQYVTTPGAQGLCPVDWHIPTDGEWTTLTTFLGGEGIAGGAMKETGTVHWTPPNTGATNSSGFTALPAGDWYSSMAVFESHGMVTLFWSSSQSGLNVSWIRYITYDSQSAGRAPDGYQPDGMSVRCLKN